MIKHQILHLGKTQKIHTTIYQLTRNPHIQCKPPVIEIITVPKNLTLKPAQIHPMLQACIDALECSSLSPNRKFFTQKAKK